jgi:uncharacterized iron-regulated membrane protein
MANNERVKRSLAAHSVLGLSAAACMYWICLTGTLLVFAAQLARWEQPQVVESMQYKGAQVESAVLSYLRAHPDEKEKSVTIMLPTEEMPRMVAHGETDSYFINVDGSLGDRVDHEWLEFVEHFHTSLHMPHSIGTIVVSVFGVMLGSLIISGLYAHPRIFRDAFRLRLGGNRRLQLVDVHNRLGVWGLPFHLMIAVTGALFGMISILVLLAAPKYFDGDRDAIVDAVYGPDPVIEAAAQDLQLAQALQNYEARFADTTPIFLIAQNIGSANQFIEIGATVPGRLIYSEMYRFYADGRYQGYQQLSDGPVGRQIVYSIYRIHFGQFGGLWVRFAYLVLGLSMTVLAATGVSIWLARRGGRDRLNDLWCAVVWGTPLAFVLTFFAALLTAWHTVLVFVVALLMTLAYTFAQANVERARAKLQLLTGGLLVMAVIANSIVSGASPLQIYIAAVNIAGMIIATLFIYLGQKSAEESLPQEQAQEA